MYYFEDSILTFNNTQKLLAGALALVLVAGMTSPAFAQPSPFGCGVMPSQVHIQIDSGGTFEFDTVTNCSSNWVSGTGPVNTCDLNSVVSDGPPNINNPQISFSFIVTNLGDTSEEHCQQEWEFEDSSGVVISVIQELWINEPQVAGELLPLDSTALMIAGLSSMSVWMIPTVLGLAGVGVYLVKFRKQ